ncbi:MAG: GNAT family N-acetyltransferase [Candidatus Dormibacteraeota bacterium]|nr:GNAT family N-acetyltransferase [Candidatus Dormibacteraeota bacterium]
MKLRSASLLDLSRIEQIHREAEARFSPVAPPARLWGLVSQTLSAILPLSQETLLFVAEDRGRVIGFVQASGRPLTLSLPAKASTLQVLNLCVAADADEQEVSTALVEHLVEYAGRGVHRLFVRIPLDDPLLRVFRIQGFRQYATETVVYAEQPEPRSDATPFGLRTMRARDSRLLYQLYRKVTPRLVATLEAPTYRDWRALRATPGEQELVERVEVVAWCGVQRSRQARPHLLSLMALPEAGLADEVADHALVAVRGEPVWSSLRHYDAHMIDALRGRGFELLLTQALLVRELTVREPVTESGLVPSFG